MTPAEEANEWGAYFDFGSFLLAGAEDRLGLGEDVEGAARDAWRRLGRQYMDEGIGRREDLDCGHGRWALAVFGEPPDAD